jgi:hypothetical protein
MSWNYRVMKKLNSDGDFDFGIYEVYYNDNKKVISYSKNSMTPLCSSLEDLKYEIENKIMKAFKSDVLEYKEE